MYVLSVCDLESRGICLRSVMVLPNDGSHQSWDYEVGTNAPGGKPLSVMVRKWDDEAYDFIPMRYWKCEG